MRKFIKVPKEVPVSELSPLNISCRTTKCEEELHCFSVYQARAIKKYGTDRVCYECGATLKDWDRIHKRDILDAKYVFIQLKNELIRHVYWHMAIKDEDMERAQIKGAIKIEEEAIKRLTKEIGIAKPFREKGITPYYGNIIYYGQHATATCCRLCMKYWHNIPQGRAMTEEEIEYCTKLIMLYIKERVPSLKN